MNTEKKLAGLNSKLESYMPKPEDRDELIDYVMSSISGAPGQKRKDLVSDFLFGWTDTLWIKRSLVTVSLALVCVFVFQQFSIVNRIGRLESRMVDSNTEKLIKKQGEYVLLNSLLRSQVDESELTDSIKVADKDLRALIKSYSELEKRYEILQRELYQERFNVNTNKQKL